MTAARQTPRTGRGSTEHPGARWLTGRLVNRLDALAGEIAADPRPATRPLLVGAGAGDLRRRLEGRFGSCVATDLSDADRPGAALRLPFHDGELDLVVAVAVLEHLREPAAGLRELARVSSRHLLLAVPHEPFFRAADLLCATHLSGRSPGPVQHWSGAGFQRLVSQVANVRAVASPHPWTTVWATRV